MEISYKIRLSFICNYTRIELTQYRMQHYIRKDKHDTDRVALLLIICFININVQRVADTIKCESRHNILAFQNNDRSYRYNKLKLNINRKNCYF